MVGLPPLCSTLLARHAAVCALLSGPDPSAVDSTSTAPNLILSDCVDSVLCEPKITENPKTLLVETDLPSEVGSHSSSEQNSPVSAITANATPFVYRNTEFVEFLVGKLPELTEGKPKKYRSSYANFPVGRYLISRKGIKETSLKETVAEFTETEQELLGFPDVGFKLQLV
jgi:hypothetical protein